MFDCDRKDCWVEKGATGEDKWVELFNGFHEKNILVVNLMNVTEFIFCFPATSAPVE
jgi:hypothetical protein